MGLPVLTDVHEPEQCARVAQAVDVLQIPAFLCRQTDLLVAAAKTGRAINVKKGQFLAPWDMANVVDKIRRRRQSTGSWSASAAPASATTRWSPTCARCRSWRELGVPVVFDATHSVQQPGGQGTSSGGQREFAPVLARAAVAVGVAAVFMETHPDPDKAPSDGPNMIPMKQLSAVLEILLELDRLAKTHPVVV